MNKIKTHNNMLKKNKWKNSKKIYLLFVCIAFTAFGSLFLFTA